MKKKMTCLVLLAVAAALLGGCFAAPAAAEPKEITSEDGVFTVRVPADYEQLETGTLNAASSIEAASVDEYFLALMESKVDFDLDFEGYADLVAGLTEEGYGTSLGEPAETTVDGNKARRYAFEITMENVRFGMIYCVIETKDYYGAMFLWTNKSNVENMEASAETILGSFHQN